MSTHKCCTAQWESARAAPIASLDSANETLLQRPVMTTHQGFRLGFAAVLVTVAMLTGSCQQAATQPPQPSQIPPPPEVGRYQVVVTSEGDRGSVLFLVD